MHEEPDLAVDIANRINDVMRELPDGVQPGHVLTALAAVSARLLTKLRPEDREGAYQFLVTTVRLHSGLPPRQ
jgi:hypothetical protein